VPIAYFCYRKEEKFPELNNVVTGAMWSNVFGSHKKNSASVVALD
jgi:hypothetical protein